MEILDSIDLKLSMNNKWESYWVVGCHSNWYWRKNEMHEESFNRLENSRLHVKNRVDEYDISMMNNKIVVGGITHRS